MVSVSDKIWYSIRLALFVMNYDPCSVIYIQPNKEKRGLTGLILNVL